MTTLKLISTSEVSRLIQEPVSRILKRIHKGTLTPDGIAMDGRLFLFREDRAPSIKALISEL